MVVLGTIRSFLEPFCGHLSPKIDKVCEELTFDRFSSFGAFCVRLVLLQVPSWSQGIEGEKVRVLKDEVSGGLGFPGLGVG